MGISFATGKVLWQEVSLLEANDMWTGGYDNGLMVKPRRHPSAKRPRKPAQEPEDAIFLREWLHALGLRQGAVARDAGVNEGYVSQIANRERWPNERPTVTTLRRLAGAMQMPWRLLYEPPPPDPIPIDMIARYPADLIQRIARARARRKA